MKRKSMRLNLGSKMFERTRKHAALLMVPVQDYVAAMVRTYKPDKVTIDKLTLTMHGKRKKVTKRRRRKGAR